MNYTIEKFDLENYKFNFAQWSHPYCSPKKFTQEQINTQTTYLNKGDIVIDIGAFSGDTPVLYANAVGKKGKIISFEANPHAYEILEVNSKLNNHLNIIPINKAITEKPGKYTFHYSDKGFCNGGFAEEIDMGVGATGHVVPLEVEGVNLTNWLENNLDKQEWDKISFIKIDTEGYDYKILRSNKKLFKQIRPILEVELYPALSLREVKEFYKILKEIGYEVFQQNKGRDCSLNSLTTSLDERGFIRTFKNIKSGQDIVAYPKEKVPKEKLKQPMKISLIQPSRNNLKYLKWSYNSIRKNQGDHEVEICVADDFSNKDNTWEWCQEMMEKDPLFKAIRNEGPTRLGHTILYDTLVNDVATSDVCMIYHADMYLCPGALDAIEKHLKEKTIVSLTRIEPPLHPDGPEKVLRDYGIEPEEFKEDLLLNNLGSSDFTGPGLNTTTEGIFAPWAFWKKDFQEIGGHDPIFAPQSKEDTDIFNRFHLNGIKFIQTWEGFVYHMTCRGSRFADGAQRNPNGEVFMKNRETDEWLKQNQKSTREFLRKWGHFCKHDALMKPIVPPKYDIGIILTNTKIEQLELLEPWCSNIYTDGDYVAYQQQESLKTSFDLNDRVRILESGKINNILVNIDGNTFTQSDFQILQQLSEIIQDSGEVGEFELGNLKIKINDLKTYENTLIKV
jgi:FkbM family methyltransferase